MRAMDAKLWFWSWALLNMALVVAFGARGLRAIRANRVAEHRRSMLTACALVGVFLLAYLAKRALIGGEDRAAWSPAARLTLYVHESFIAGMLIAGGSALALGRRLARTRRVTGAASDPLAPEAALRRHRLAGRIALGCVALGFATACGILGGMLARA
jgi:uncharacterized membrane protein YozB (DUF420 family)